MIQEISNSSIDAIRSVAHFKNGQYASLDINKTIDFFSRYYIDAFEGLINIDENTVIADIGTGYGWLAIAWALRTPAKIIAIDMDAERLDAAREIAEIIGVADRIDWRAGSLGNLPLDDASVDIACCIEVVEHVYGDTGAIADLGRVSRDIVLVTTPNRLFPAIAHDTRLPFCHWLPVPLRILYAKAVRRQYTEIDNIFWSRRQLNQILSGYEYIDGFMHRRDYASYMEVYPYYLPYGSGKMVHRIGRMKGLYFALASRVKLLATHMLPNLASIYRISK